MAGGIEVYGVGHVANFSWIEACLLGVSRPRPSTHNNEIVRINRANEITYVFRIGFEFIVPTKIEDSLIFQVFCNEQPIAHALLETAAS